MSFVKTNKGTSLIGVTFNKIVLKKRASILTRGVPGQKMEFTGIRHYQ